MAQTEQLFTEKQANTILAYIPTIDPLTGKGNISQAILADNTLSADPAYKLTKRKDFAKLVELVQIKEYTKRLKITDLTKEDLIRKVEIAVCGFEEYLHPVTGMLEVVKISSQLKRKARVELAALNKWNDKTVNHKHDITDFLNKVASKGFTMPKQMTIDNAIPVTKL